MNGIFLQIHMLFDRSIFELFRIFGDFYVSGMQDTEVTKSLQRGGENQEKDIPEMGIKINALVFPCERQ